MTFWQYMWYRLIEGALVFAGILLLLFACALVSVVWRGWKRRGKNS